MAARTTRMLLLGAVALFGPVNGYQIRRELSSWRVDEWANIKPGSVYHGLAALAASGSLVRHDLPDNGRSVAVYEISATGRADLDELIVDAVRTVNMFSRNEFHTAFAMSPLLGHDRMLVLLRERLATMLADSADAPAVLESAYVPPVARRSARLWLAEAQAELQWLYEVVTDADAGTLRLDDEGWAPPADDPGYQMQTDRERYLRLLGR